MQANTVEIGTYLSNPPNFVPFPRSRYILLVEKSWKTPDVRASGTINTFVHYFVFVGHDLVFFYTRTCTKSAKLGTG